MGSNEVQDIILEELKTINGKLDDLMAIKPKVESHEKELVGHDGLIQTVARHTERLDTGNKSERISAVTAVICTIVAIGALIVSVTAAGWAKGNEDSSIGKRDHESISIMRDR